MKANTTRFKEAQARRREFLELLAVLPTINETCRQVGVTKQAYANWRERFPDFAAQADAVLAMKKAAKDPTNRNFDQGFAAFRLRYFETETPTFQHQVVEAYENTPVGNLTMILLPPEHGKTTLFEDYASYKLAIDPSFRFTVGCETSALSKKILGRVRMRMDPMGPFRTYVHTFGPFAPLTKNDGNERKMRQPWADDRFNVFRKGEHDERDYSMVALGMNSQVAGTRTDHLHADDVQSLNNINQTDSLVEKFRQDWLSRPGEHGRTTINGTRVDEGDFYEAIEEALPEDILRVIRMPAIVYDTTLGEHRPLWPERYSMEMLDRIRTKVGEDAWARNYMQQPRSRSLKTFTPQVVEPCFNPLRSILHDPQPGTRIAIGLDPSIGGVNAFFVGGLHPKKLEFLWVDERTDLASNEAIMNVLEELCHQFSTNGCYVSDVIIETMAFQKGLVEDQALKRVQKRFGFQVREHLTGVNKYDENIGVPSMVTNFIREEIDLPWAPHGATRTMVGDFVNQLYAWKPKLRGTRLRQDQVMAFWFVWILWRDQVRRMQVEASNVEVSSRRLPWTPTSFVPTGYAGVR